MSAALKPKTGNTVRLKSGGPSMTVMERSGYGAGTKPPIYSNDEMNCVWFDEAGHCHERVFALETLH